jgi:flagellar operon protein
MTIRVGFHDLVAPVQKKSRTAEPRLNGRGVEQTFEQALRDLETKRTEASSELSKANEADGVQFSKHATTRLRSRGIELSSQDMEDLSGAIDRLSKKNARESLLLLGDHAFIVGIPKRTVITAMTRSEAVGSIFTNIDSTLVVR